MRESMIGLKRTGDKAIVPSIYIQYLVDGRGESPTPQQLRNILDHIELYIDRRCQESHNLAMKVDKVVPQGSHGWTSDGAAADRRRYIDGDGDKERLKDKTRLHYNVYSQNPHILLTIEGMEFVITTENMANRAAPGEIRNAVSRTEIPGSATGPQDIAPHLKSILRKDIAVDLLEEISVFANNQDINVLSFSASGNRILMNARREVKLTEFHQLFSLVLNPPYERIITIFRPATPNGQLLDEFWDQRANLCLQKGIYPHYAQILGTEVHGWFFKEAVTEWTPLPRQFWMVRRPEDEDDDDDMGGDFTGAEIYGSHPALTRFTSLKEYEILQKAALILERQHVLALSHKIFDGKTAHTAHVIVDGDDYVQFDIQLAKFDGVISPPIQIGTTFSIKPWSEGEIMETDSGPIEVRKTEWMPWRGTALDIAPTWDVLMSVSFPRRSASLALEDGTEILVTLSEDINHTPFTRQFAAIGHAGCLKDRNPMKQTLLGLMDTEPAPAVTPLQALLDEKDAPGFKASMDAFKKGFNLNEEQEQAFDQTFKSDRGIGLVQGPPGTGKTTLNAFLAVYAASHGIPVLATAPSNTATKAIMNKAVAQLARLDENIRKNFKVVYFPTMSVTSGELQNVEEQETEAQDAMNSLLHDDSASGDERLLVPFCLAAHVVQLAEEKSSNGDSDAAKWLRTRQYLCRKMSLPSKNPRQEYKDWIKLSKKYAKELFEDSAVKLVVCTCSNSAHELRQGFLPLFNIVDEAAFGNEADVMTPLQGPARMILLAGDHEQLQPIVTSKKDNEYANQIALSLFERMVASPIPFVCLKVNFRMPPQIATLPGALTYGGLKCAPGTQVERPVFLAWKSWYLKPETKFESWRRFPPNQDPNKDYASYRRFFLNVAGFSGSEGNSRSLVNFANVNVIVNLVGELLGHQPLDGVPPISTSDITIQVPYGAQRSLIKQQLDLRHPQYDIRVKTIDSNQGGETAIIILDLTPANSHHGSALGFLIQWNRMNVALTRPSDVLIIVGNFDLWFMEIELIYKRCHNWAYFLQDLLSCGDVIDLAGPWDARHELPTSRTQLPSPATWTRRSPTSASVVLHPRAQATLRNSKIYVFLTKLHEELAQKIGESLSETFGALNFEESAAQDQEMTEAVGKAAEQTLDQEMADAYEKPADQTSNKAGAQERGPAGFDTLDTADD
jgi:hypothetical protein